MPIYNVIDRAGNSINFESYSFIDNTMISTDNNVNIITSNGLIYIYGITNIECECNNEEFITDGNNNRLLCINQKTYNIQCDRWVRYSDIINANIFSYLNTSVELPNKKYVHEYNYKPEYIKHVLPDEDISTTLLLGVEIEVGGNQKDPGSDDGRNDIVKKCIQIMNESDSDEEKFIYSTHDSSVQIELDTMPCSLRYHKEKMNYKELFKYLDEIGYKGHDCESAGLHVHVNRDYLGETKFQQELVISKILYLMEKFNKEICVIARRSTYYSDFPGDKEKVETLFSNFDKYLVRGKNAALNLQHPNTIEFRMFKSTLNYDSFINVLDFVACLVDYTRATSIEDIEFTKWEDFMNVFPNNLKKYYTYRFEYESDIDVKKIKKRIQTLKHDIKYCKSSLQRKQLENDLNKYQKKLKDVLKKKKDETSKNVVNHNVSGVNWINNHNHNIVQGQGTGVSSSTINANDLRWNIPDYVSTATAAITSNIHGIFTGTVSNNIEHATL